MDFVIKIYEVHCGKTTLIKGKTDGWSMKTAAKMRNKNDLRVIEDVEKSIS